MERSNSLILSHLSSGLIIQLLSAPPRPGSWPSTTSCQWTPGCCSTPLSCVVTGRWALFPLWSPYWTPVTLPRWYSTVCWASWLFTAFGTATVLPRSSWWYVCGWGLWKIWLCDLKEQDDLFKTFCLVKMHVCNHKLNETMLILSAIFNGCLYKRIRKTHEEIVYSETFWNNTGLICSLSETI